MIFGLVAVTLAAMGAISVSVVLLVVVLRKTNTDAWLAILEKLCGVLAVDVSVLAVDVSVRKKNQLRDREGIYISYGTIRLGPLSKIFAHQHWCARWE
jgi:hypothetical protein